ncbi:hypothetical protein DICA3_A04412 [Diutina catenulata]
MARTSIRKLALPFVGLAVVAAVYWFFFTGGDDSFFSPEQINSILQSKQSGVVDITKRELTSKRLPAAFGVPGQKDWDYFGSAIVKSNEYVRLTSEAPHQAGSVWSLKPIEAQSFEMELTFKITSESESKLIGDGMAVWLLNEISPIGDVFGAKNYFNGLGVMIDTYKNGKRGVFPYVNIMVGNGGLRYDKATDGLDARLAGCSAKDVVNPKSVTKMRLVRLKNGYLSIDFNWNGNHEQWVNCAVLEDVDLPVPKYLGISAETGDLYETVEVLENRMYSLSKPNGEEVVSVDELQTMIEAEAPDLSAKKAQQKRKSMARLRAAEKRIKKANAAHRLKAYGDEGATFVRRVWWRIQSTVKWTVVFAVAVIAVWFAWIIVRMQRQNRRRKVTGLLD